MKGFCVFGCLNSCSFPEVPSFPDSLPTARHIKSPRSPRIEQASQWSNEIKAILTLGVVSLGILFINADPMGLFDSQFEK